MKNQAKSNMRYDFSVVGLLNETYYDIIVITDRIDYVNMTYNTKVSGGRHKTKSSQMNVKCKELFQKNTTFQEMVWTDVPAFAALEWVFEVGVAVNWFPKEELVNLDYYRAKSVQREAVGC